MIRIILVILCLATVAGAESLTLVRVPGTAEIKTRSTVQPVTPPAPVAVTEFTPEGEHYYNCGYLFQNKPAVNRFLFLPGAGWQQTIQPTVNGVPVDTTLQNYTASFSTAITSVDLVATVTDWYIEDEVFTAWSYAPALNGSPVTLAVNQSQAPESLKPDYRQTAPIEDTVDILTTPINGQKLWRFPLSDVVGPMNRPQSVVVTHTWVDREFSSYWDWVDTVDGQANSSEPLTMNQVMTLPLLTLYQPVSDTVVYEIGKQNGYKRWQFTVSIPLPATVVAIPLSAGISHTAGNIVLTLPAAETRKLNGLSGYFRLMGSSTMISFPLEPYPSVTRP